MRKKILLVTPKFPYPPSGADEADRAAGLEILLRLGFDVYVISKVYAESYKAEAVRVAKELGTTIVPITYKYLYLRTWRQKVWHGLKRCLTPWYPDGAAYEYTEPEIQQAVTKALDSFKPDLVWFDYTFLWPLYRQVRKRHIPIVTRSCNFEPAHFLEEEGRTLFNYVRSIAKLITEYTTVRWSDFLFAITPLEERTYRRLGAKHSATLPLRSLPRLLTAPVHDAQRSGPLNVFFSGSTYNVPHNRKALEFFLAQIIPAAQRQFPGQFEFHIFGGKVPEQFKKYFVNGVVNHGYLDLGEFNELMERMDVAVVPSLFGAGMQQKIFEPLCRGIPTITSARGMAGYPFQDHAHLLLAENAPAFVRCLGELRDPKRRQELSVNARALAQKLFSSTAIEEKVHSVLQPLFSGKAI
ncbi:MAG: glycosyltransferase family 4 protein [Candidatus Magasanikbacteria bacterium]|nr:glycosyltransferase family 4 protein [Candidatus Magasanikbacteria bacterium]